jgi:hypothetical protein
MNIDAVSITIICVKNVKLDQIFPPPVFSELVGEALLLGVEVTVGFDRDGWRRKNSGHLWK